MIDGKTRKNRFGSYPGAPTAVAAVGEGSEATIEYEFQAGWLGWRGGAAAGP